jgi:hypothetical protein
MKYGRNKVEIRRNKVASIPRFSYLPAFTNLFSSAGRRTGSPPAGGRNMNEGLNEMPWKRGRNAIEMT